MRIQTVFLRLTPLALLVSASGTAPASAAEMTPPPSAHTTQSIEGWTVRIDDHLLKGEHAPAGARALRLLAARLVAITAVVPEKPLDKLRAIMISTRSSPGN